MGTLVDILDFAVLLLIVVLIPRAVRKGQSKDSGSLTLTVFIAVAVIVFAVVSFSAYLGLVEVSSMLTRGIFFVILLAMAALLRSAIEAKPAA